MIHWKKYIFVAYVSVLCHLVTGFNVTPCKIDDDDCILQTAKELVSQIFATLDPMHIDKIDVNLSVLHFMFLNATLTGFKTCSLSSLKIPLKQLLEQKQADFHAVIECERLFLSSDYEIDGTLIILPVTGKGSSTISAGEYKIQVNANVRIQKGKDDKDHLQIKNVDVNSEAISAIKYDFKNLFNGQKELSDAVHKMANENWKEIASLVNKPLFSAYFKQIISTMKKFLKTVPVESLYLKKIL